jgi:hypothetical protein
MGTVAPSSTMDSFIKQQSTTPSTPQLPPMGQGFTDPSMYQTQPGQFNNQPMMGASSGPLATPMSVPSSSPFDTQYPSSATASFPNGYQSMGQDTMSPSVPDNNLRIVAESLDNLSEYIANKIAQKMQTLTSSTTSDSFNAFANAATTMAQSPSSSVSQSQLQGQGVSQSM